MKKKIKKTGKIPYHAYYQVGIPAEFIPNWQRNMNPETGKSYNSKEEAMLFAIRCVMDLGEVCTWDRTVFQPQKFSKK